MDHETLGAYADGELPPEEAAAVERHLADHPEDRAYVDRTRAQRAAIARAFAPIAAEPLPPALSARVEAAIAAAGQGAQAATGQGATAGQGATLVPLRRPARAGGRRGWLAGGALAAAAAALVAVTVARDGSGPAGTEIALGPVPADAPLAAALDGLIAGVAEPRAEGGALEIVASFADGRGRLCRELRLEPAGGAAGEVAIACAAGGQWTVEAVIALGARDEMRADGEDRFEIAAGPDLAAIEAALDALGAGPILTPEEEAAARDRGWRP